MMTGAYILTETVHMNVVIVMKIIMIRVFIPYRSYLIGILSTIKDSEQAKVVGVVTRIVDDIPVAVQVIHVQVAASVFVHVAVITCPTISIIHTIYQLREEIGVDEGEFMTSWKYGKVQASEWCTQGIVLQCIVL